MSNKIEKIKCQRCGKKFQNYISAHRMFCSISCANASKNYIPSFAGYKHTEEWKKKRSIMSSGKNGGMFGKHHSKDRKGWKLSDKTKKKMSESRKGEKNPMYRMSAEKSPSWRGGKSFEPYGLEFNEDLKEVIRNRDRRKCQLCEKTELENGKKLDCHHIDYNKQNNNPKNLISLCRNCHNKTTHNRDYWTNYFLCLIG